MPNNWMSAQALNTDFYEIRVTSDRPLDDAAALTLFRSIGYAFRQHLRGESLGLPQRAAPNCWTASYDVTKSRSDDWLARLDDALADAGRYAVAGTPARKSAGDTRLNPGLGPVKLGFEFR